MTIKVCKQSLYDKLELLGKIYLYVSELFFLALIPLGIYGMITHVSFSDVINVFFVWVLVGSFESVALWKYHHDKHILKLINKRFKIFSWRNDCCKCCESVKKYLDSIKRKK